MVKKKKKDETRQQSRLRERMGKVGRVRGSRRVRREFDLERNGVSVCACVGVCLCGVGSV